MFDFFAITILILISFIISTDSIVFGLLSLVGIYFMFLWLVFALGYEFLAVTIFIVYLGAVIVLFLFVVMMLNLESSASVFRSNKLLAFLLLAQFLTLLAINVHHIYFIIFRPINELHLKEGIIRESFIHYTNIEQIGLVLYTDFFIGFIVIGFLLLISLIGAMEIVFKKNA